MQQENGEKEFAPSQRRLDDARSRGEIAISRDLAAAATTGGLLFAAWAWPQGAEGPAVILQGLLERPETAAHYGGEGLLALAGSVALPLLPWFLIPALFVLLSLFAQRGLIFAPDRLQPKLNRISPLAGFKRKFGLTGIVEFLRSALKLTLIAALLIWLLLQQSGTLLQTTALSARQNILLGAELLGGFLFWLFLLQLSISLADLVWQRFDHHRRLRMTRKEMTDELRQSEGDPHLKAKRRQRSEEIATRTMIADVAKASVVLVNPEHYAVALAWQRGSRHAPVCLAKGTDEIALRIREAAERAKVPIRRDPPAARALYASVAVGEEIRPDHYRAVAAAIRYAESLRSKSAGRWRS
ncbi:flagellar type III secretion system protein FlhB [Falsigemmobacter faecalis]|uniref:Flagellar biosynthesis protein FlhB n=1 Tax=Falsigemmobacter faecalis TaxID=2488730 RepID=A0A3P3DJ53_9RHOB|nr:flagellar type III secretion system protein FlhB [Falsigemmobacter faecalis]RRH74289.1 flagellar biosynthesis protein FlhB [Falsigemmobacter faecalis]